MSLADKIFVENCKNILENGVWDKEFEVRPRWEDSRRQERLSALP